MRFSNIVEHAMKETALKRIRMKTDPRDSANPSDSKAYEGYIIEEQDGMLKIMLVSPDAPLPRMSVQPDDVEMTGDRTFQQFKSFTINYIHKIGKCDCNAATHDNLANAGDIQHLEMFLKELGIESDEFQKIIKMFLMS